MTVSKTNSGLPVVSTPTYQYSELFKGKFKGKEIENTFVRILAIIAAYASMISSLGTSLLIEKVRNHVAFNGSAEGTVVKARDFAVRKFQEAELARTDLKNGKVSAKAEDAKTGNENKAMVAFIETVARHPAYVNAKTVEEKLSLLESVADNLKTSKEFSKLSFNMKPEFTKFANKNFVRFLAECEGRGFATKIQNREAVTEQDIANVAAAIKGSRFAVESGYSVDEIAALVQKQTVASLGSTAEFDALKTNFEKEATEIKEQGIEHPIFNNAKAELENARIVLKQANKDLKNLDMGLKENVENFANVIAYFVPSAADAIRAKISNYTKIGQFKNELVIFTNYVKANGLEYQAELMLPHLDQLIANIQVIIDQKLDAVEKRDAAQKIFDLLANRKNNELVNNAIMANHHNKELLKVIDPRTAGVTAVAPGVVFGPKFVSTAAEAQAQDPVTFLLQDRDRLLAKRTELEDSSQKKAAECEELKGYPNLNEYVANLRSEIEQNDKAKQFIEDKLEVYATELKRFINSAMPSAPAVEKLDQSAFLLQERDRLIANLYNLNDQRERAVNTYRSFDGVVGQEDYSMDLRKTIKKIDEAIEYVEGKLEMCVTELKRFINPAMSQKDRLTELTEARDVLTAQLKSLNETMNGAVTQDEIDAIEANGQVLAGFIKELDQEIADLGYAAASAPELSDSDDDTASVSSIDSDAPRVEEIFDEEETKPAPVRKSRKAPGMTTLQTLEDKLAGVNMQLSSDAELLDRSTRQKLRHERASLVVAIRKENERVAKEKRDARVNAADKSAKENDAARMQKREENARLAQANRKAEEANRKTQAEAQKKFEALLAEVMRLRDASQGRSSNGDTPREAMSGSFIPTMDAETFRFEDLPSNLI